MDAINQKEGLSQNQSFCSHVGDTNEVMPRLLVLIVILATLYRYLSVSLDKHTMLIHFPFQKSQVWGTLHSKAVPSNATRAQTMTTVATILPRRWSLTAGLKLKVKRIMESFERARLVMYNKDAAHRFCNQSATVGRYTRQTKHQRTFITFSKSESETSFLCFP